MPQNVPKRGFVRSKVTAFELWNLWKVQTICLINAIFHLLVREYHFSVLLAVHTVKFVSSSFQFGLWRQNRAACINFSAFRDKHQSKPTLRDLQSKSGANITPNPIPAFTSEHPAPPVNSQPNLGATLLDMSPTHTEPPSAEVTLTDVFVPLESIQPSE